MACTYSTGYCVTYIRFSTNWNRTFALEKNGMRKRRQIHTERENESIRVRKKAARHLFVVVLFSFQSFGRSYFAYYSLILHIIHISWVYVAIRVGLCCQTIKPIGTKNCKLCVWDNERVCVCVWPAQNHPISKCVCENLWDGKMNVNVHTFRAFLGPFFSLLSFFPFLPVTMKMITSLPIPIFRTFAFDHQRHRFVWS